MQEFAPQPFTTESPTGGLNLPYRLKPEATQKEINEYSNLYQGVPPLGKTPKQAGKLTMFLAKASPYASVQNVTIAVGAWTALMVALTLSIGNGMGSTLPILMIYNLIGYGLLRWTLRHGYLSLLASLMVGWVIYATWFTGLNTIFFMLTQLLLAAIEINNRRGESFSENIQKTWRSSKSGASPAGAASINDSLRPIWGTAGANIAAHRDFGEKAAIGAQGEALVGEALNDFAKTYPHVRVFHGLCFTPGKRGADVDHAVIIGNFVYLIDAKYWSFASYSWRNNGVTTAVTKNNEYFSGSNVHMDAAVEKWQRYMGATGRVTSRIALAKTENARGKYSYSISNIGHPKGVELSSIKTLMEELEEAVRSGDVYVDRFVVQLVKQQLQ